MESKGSEMVLVRTFDGKQVRQRRGDGYFDATGMCQATGKKWNDYWRNKQAKEFIEALTGSAGIPADLLVQVKTTGPNENRGTWIHPHVALHLAQWCSPQFAVQVSQWVHELLTTGRVDLNTGDRPSRQDQLERVVERLVMIVENIQTDLANRPVLPMHGFPRTTVQERCRFKGWTTTSQRQRAEVRRLANVLLMDRHGETPDLSAGLGSPCVYYAHQIPVLDEAIDRMKAEYEREERAGARLWAD